MSIKNYGTKKANEVSYDVVEKCGVLATKGNRSLELRVVAWNNAEPKYDLREWYLDSDEIERCGKGITLTGDELTALKDILNSL